MVMVQGVCTSKLKTDNTKLLLELELVHQVLAESDTGQNLLSSSQDEFEQEKATIMMDHEVDLAVLRKMFWDYRLSHRRKLHDPHMELEMAVNEIGARCLPYPEKGSTISEIAAWFNKEIQVLPDAIAKANKNFTVYCLVGVLKMLQEHVRCCHLDGLESIMAVCHASIFHEVPENISKLSAHIVKRWWSLCGLPYVTEAFRIKSEVKFFVLVSQHSFVLVIYLCLCCDGGRK
jgi:hypothetical protein